MPPRKRGRDVEVTVDTTVPVSGEAPLVPAAAAVVQAASGHHLHHLCSCALLILISLLSDCGHSLLCADDVLEDLQQVSIWRVLQLHLQYASSSRLNRRTQRRKLKHFLGALLLEAQGKASGQDRRMTTGAREERESSSAGRADCGERS